MNEQAPPILLWLDDEHGRLLKRYTRFRKQTWRKESCWLNSSDWVIKTSIRRANYSTIPTHSTLLFSIHNSDTDVTSSLWLFSFLHVPGIENGSVGWLEVITQLLLPVNTVSDGGCCASTIFCHPLHKTNIIKLQVFQSETVEVSDRMWQRNICATPRPWNHSSKGCSLSFREQRRTREVE